jgi:phage terminase small subunit
MKRKYTIVDYIEAVRQFLTKKYGSVSDEWELTISLLQQNLEMKKEIDKKIKEDGLMVVGVKGLMKNPLIETSLRLQTTILSIIKELGVTPRANGMLKSLDDNDTGEILANLLSNE